MNKLFLLGMMSLGLMACDRHDSKPTNSSMSSQYDSDNTGKNVRDRDSATLTPVDQSESEADRTITQRIRQAIMADDALSTNAKNIKIITARGVVTLRGPVLTVQEKEAIIRKIQNIQGITRVDDQLEVSHK